MYTKRNHNSLLRKLQKRAAMFPPRKKRPSFWGSALPAAALGAGLAGTGYLAYKGLSPGIKPAIPTTPTTPTTPPSFSTPYNSDDNPSFRNAAGEALSNLEKMTVSSQPEGAPMSRGISALSTVAGTEQNIGTGAMLIGGVGSAGNYVSRGALGRTALGQGAQRIGGYFDTKPLNWIPGFKDSAVAKYNPFPSISKNLPIASKLTPFSAALSVGNVIDAYHDFESPTAKGLAMTATAVLPYLPGGRFVSGIVMPAVKGALNAAGTSQVEQVQSESKLSDMLVSMYRDMKSGSPEHRELGRQAAQHLLQNPKWKSELVDPVLHRSMYQDAATRNFGLTPVYGGAPEHNIDPTKVLLGKIQQMIANPQ